MPTTRRQRRTRPPCLHSGLVHLGIIGLLVASAGELSGCGPGGPIRWELRQDLRKPEPRVLLLICDGVGGDVLDEGCREGWLPNIDRYLVKGGARVDGAFTCVPPITYAGIATLLTGVGPGQHHIVGNHWFDPEPRLFRDYATIAKYRKVNVDCDVPTLYELIQPAASASIQCAHHRGATFNVANWATSGVRWFFEDYTGVDKLTSSSLSEVAFWANIQGHWPQLVTCYYPGADSVGHRFGRSSVQYREAVQHVDYQVGRVLEYLEHEGLLAGTYVVLVSDHGMVDVRPDGCVDLLSLIRDRWGRKVTDEVLQHGTKAERRRVYDAYDTVVCYQNGRGAFVHFRGVGGWGDSPGPAAVEAILSSRPAEEQLWNIAGVDLVTWVKGPDEAVLQSAAGRAVVQVRHGPGGPEFAYRPETGDPLGYTVDPELAAFVAAGFHGSREWLSATAGQERPDLVPHVQSLLGAPQVGQVVLFASSGYSFIRERGGHGGVQRDERRMSFLLAGPGIRPGTVVPVGRSVDLVPTVLELMGGAKDLPAHLEGESIWPAVRSAQEVPASIP